MTLKTVTVRGTLAGPDGTPASVARIVAKLSAYQTDNGVVVPDQIIAMADNSGAFVLQLWPNSRGTRGTKYLIDVFYGIRKLLSTSIVVPDVDYEVQFSDIVNAAPYPPANAAQDALSKVQAAAVDVLNDRNAAGQSAAAAQFAADAANATGNVFQDIASGLAGTLGGDYFSVPSSDETEYLILYRNDSGSAVEVKRYPSLQSVDLAIESANSAASAADSATQTLIEAKSIAPAEGKIPEAGPGGKIHTGWLTSEVTRTADLADTGDDSKASGMVWFRASGVTAVPRRVLDKLRDVVSVKDNGAKCDGSDDTQAVDDAIAEVAASGGGTVRFPNGQQNFTFRNPPNGVTLCFDGPSISRQQLGGDGPNDPNVRFNRSTMDYMDGPHIGVRREARHIRMIARGSGSITAPSGDFGLGIHFEKDNWKNNLSLPSPLGGQVVGLMLYGRDGAAPGETISTGAAGIISDIANLEESGFGCFVESTMASASRVDQSIVKSTTLQLQTLYNKSASPFSYGVYLRSNAGNQTAAVYVEGKPSSRWGIAFQVSFDSVNRYRLYDTGRQTWRSIGGLNAIIEQDQEDGSLIFKNSFETEVFRVSQSKAIAAPFAPNVLVTTEYSIGTKDHGITLVLANTLPITVTLQKTAAVGTRVPVLQRDPGKITFVTEAGAHALRNVDGHSKTKGLYAQVYVEVKANLGGESAVWYLSGDTAA